MIDVFSFANHQKFKQCPICLGATSDCTVGKGSEKFYIKRVCDKQCLYPLDVKFIFKNPAANTEESIMVTVGAWREQVLVIFKLDDKFMEIFPDKNNFSSLIKINLNHFNLKSLTGDNWESTIKSLIVFS